MSKSFNAKIWLDTVSDLVKGKGGGKDETGQGIGTETGRLTEALEEARKTYESGVQGL